MYVQELLPFYFCRSHFLGQVQGQRDGDRRGPAEPDEPPAGGLPDKPGGVRSQSQNRDQEESQVQDAVPGHVCHHWS